MCLLLIYFILIHCIQCQKKYLIDNNFAKEKNEDIDISDLIKNNSLDITEESFEYIKKRHQITSLYNTMK